MMQGLDKRVEGFLLWFTHGKRIEIERTARRVYVGKCVSFHSLGQPWKRRTDTTKDYLIKNRFECQASRANGVG